MLIACPCMVIAPSNPASALKAPDPPPSKSPSHQTILVLLSAQTTRRNPRRWNPREFEDNQGPLKCDGRPHPECSGTSRFGSLAVDGISRAWFGAIWRLEIVVLESSYSKSSSGRAVKPNQPSARSAWRIPRSNISPSSFPSPSPLSVSISISISISISVSLSVSLYLSLPPQHLRFRGLTEIFDKVAKLNIMKWFKRKKAKPAKEVQGVRSFPQYGTPPTSAAPGSGRSVAQLPRPVLERIFALVCPHTQDETYESCEQSAIEDTCMLCDLRDLAHCAQVASKWRNSALNVLYHSIRIDAVHYCDLEDFLAEKRKRKSFMRSNAEPEDTAHARLKLLCRTLTDGKGTYALNVQFLKTPYMTRETSKADLARTVAVCPNLRYIDLPEGLFMDDPSCNTLKQEVQARCHDIRKMTYMGGAEKSLELLASGTIWRHLEVLEISQLNMDSTVLRNALGSLPSLRALKVTNMVSFTNEHFRHQDYLPPFPPLTELIFNNTPNVTADGLATYLFRSDTQVSLKTLSLTATGVVPWDLQKVLSVATSLENLTIIESVTSSFPANNVPGLQSTSMKTLHYEITSASSANSYANTTTSYYTYLSSSLLAGGMPGLEELYVRDPDFPETLLDLAPPSAAFASDLDEFTPPSNPFAQEQRRFSSNNPFAKMQSAPGLKQDLTVYSKGLDEMEWNFSKVQPPAERGRRGSATIPRPISSYGLTESTGRGWAQGSGAKGTRMSYIAGNGFGGFLAVPADERPNTSSGESRKRGSQYDMWR